MLNILTIMHSHIERILLDQGTVQSGIQAIAAQLNRDYEGRELVVVMLLKGAMIFTADICRQLEMPLQIECLNVSSYHGGTESSGEVKFLDLEIPDLSGKDVLVIDDILDTGLTLAAVSQKLHALGVNSLKSCVLLNKNKSIIPNLAADYVGFEIEDEFVVGYGLDYQGLYRNLPYIGVLRADAI